MRELPEKLTLKQKRSLADWKSLGLSVDDDEFWDLWDEAFPVGRIMSAAHVRAEKIATVIREAEGVLLSLHHGTTLEEHICKTCGKPFATNYRYNRHCSDDCLAQHLQNFLGIKWDPTKSAQERWGGEPPTIIEPATLEILKKWAQAIISLPTVGPTRDTVVREEVEMFIAPKQHIPFTVENKREFVKEVAEVAKNSDDDWLKSLLTEVDGML